MTRVLLVDDSAVVRRIVRSALAPATEVEVCGEARNGAEALALVPVLKPDVVVLDVEMPVMDGLVTLRRLRRDHPTLPVVMCSTLTERGAAVTVEALSEGAADFVTKPRAVSQDRMLDSLREQIVPVLLAVTGRAPRGLVPAPAPSPQVRRAATDPGSGYGVVVIASSTGGPNALSQVLPKWDLPVPVLVVQHMPPNFTKILAERLDAACTMPVSEAQDGELVEPGRILIARGDFHLRLRGTAARPEVVLANEPPENSVRPAADVTFRDVAALWGAHALGVVLTGMGRDGTDGARAITAAGGVVIAQDEASSVVWGMPGSVVDAGLASKVVPLDAIAATVPALIRPVRDRLVAPATAAT
ncbi:MAG TPA: chemotaxis response regulator protein-glutamate methylesterase [Mycobacteriales bacterium]|nr:chemotaxis response regulator protein-glutamate methylesterase [Mycobacteriales bacterium]